jgi:endonuclease/exonuclease/phosphatase family metal-dependent hydrolase
MTQKHPTQRRRGGLAPGRRWRLVLVVGWLIAMFAIVAPGSAQADRGRVRAMTYNLFQGSELTEAISAKTPEELVVAVTTDFGQVVASKFPERAQAIAAEVESTKPDLIGLQEAALWKLGALSSNPFTAPPATTTAFDFVQILTEALTARGLHYAPVAVTNNFHVEAPGFFGTGFRSVSLTDRVAILARTDIPLAISNVKTGNFATNTEIPLLSGPFKVLGGWASVDATRRTTARFVTTHLDPILAPVRTAQAAELVAGPLNTTLPVVLTCDCNSDPSTAAYATLTASGLGDAWLQARENEPGFTCCQQTPSLLNPTSTLTSRIDYVFSRGRRLQAQEAQLLGAEQSSRTPAGLWPSDHAGLFAKIGSDD